MLWDLKLRRYGDCRKWLSAIILGILFFAFIPVVNANPTVWEVMSQEFRLNHETTRPEVQAQIKWLMHHTGYLRQFSQAEPYLYHIITEIKKHHLPGELALIPMVESAYNPFAYSGKGAAGLWQIMPGTGNHLGLQQNWWHDGRRNILSSTGAALNYLEYLQHFFHGNWLLAIAAYDAGEGAVSRSIQKKHELPSSADFWTLPLPRETRRYVPRLLALAEIVQNAQYYHVQLPSIPHTPYFQEIMLNSQIDLPHAAQLAGISFKDLLKLNPGYNHWTNVPNKPYKLLIPMHNVSLLSQNLSNTTQDQTVSWIRYRVKPGDSLKRLALQYHTSVENLKSLNQLKSNRLPLGQFILIPNDHYAAKPTSPTVHFPKPKLYKVIYVVEKKDDIHKIAKKFHLSETQIKSWNHLAEETILEPDQTLLLWRSNPRT